MHHHYHYRSNVPVNADNINMNNIKNYYNVYKNIMNEANLVQQSILWSTTTSNTTNHRHHRPPQIISNHLTTHINSIHLYVYLKVSLMNHWLHTYTRKKQIDYNLQYYRFSIGIVMNWNGESYYHHIWNTKMTLYTLRYWLYYCTCTAATMYYLRTSYITSSNDTRLDIGNWIQLSTSYMDMWNIWFYTSR